MIVMELIELTQDLAAVNEGEWQSDIPGAGNLELRVRGISGNALFKDLQNKMLRELPEARRGSKLSDADEYNIDATCLAETVLLEWRNLTMNGEVVPYSKERALRYLRDPVFRPLKNAVEIAGERVSRKKAQRLEDDIKN